MDKNIRNQIEKWIEEQFKSINVDIFKKTADEIAKENFGDLISNGVHTYEVTDAIKNSINKELLPSLENVYHNMLKKGTFRFAKKISEQLSKTDFKDFIDKGVKPEEIQKIINTDVKIINNAVKYVNEYFDGFYKSAKALEKARIGRSVGRGTESSMNAQILKKYGLYDDVLNKLIENKEKKERKIAKEIHSALNSVDLKKITSSDGRRNIDKIYDYYKNKGKNNDIVNEADLKEFFDEIQKIKDVPSYIIKQEVQGARKKIQTIDKVAQNVATKKTTRSNLAFTESDLEKLLGKDFLNGEHIIKMIMNSYKTDKSRQGALTDLVKKSPHFDKLFGQLKKVTEERDLHLAAAVNETEGAIEFLMLTNEEFNKYMAADSSKKRRKMVSDMLKPGSSTFHKKISIGEKGHYGESYRRGGAMTANDIAFFGYDNNGKYVGGRSEAEVAKLIKLLSVNKNALDTRAALAMAGKSILEEPFTQNLNSIHKSLLGNRIELNGVTENISNLATNVYGVFTDSARALETINMFVYRLAALYKKADGSFDWDNAVRSQADDQRQLSRIQNTPFLKRQVEQVASLLSQFGFDPAYGSNRAIANGIIQIGRGVYQSPAKDISSDYGKHTSQSIAFGEYDSKALEARTKGNQIRIIDKNTAKLSAAERKAIVSEGGLSTSGVLYLHPEKLAELYTKFARSQLAKGEMVPQFSVGGLAGDAAIVSDRLLENSVQTKSNRKHTMGESRFKELLTNYLKKDDLDKLKNKSDIEEFLNSERGEEIFKKILLEDKYGLSGTNVGNVRLSKNQKGQMEFLFDEIQDPKVSGRMGGNLTGDRNAVSSLTTKFFQWLENEYKDITGGQQVDMIKLLESTGVNNAGGLLLTILQAGIDRYSNKAEREDFASRVLGSEEMGRFFKYDKKSQSFVTNPNVDKNGIKERIDLLKAMSELSGLDEYKYIGNAATFGTNVSHVLYGRDAINTLYDWEHNRPGRWGVREFASNKREIELLKKKGIDMSAAEAYYDSIQNEETAESLKAKAYTEAVKKNAQSNAGFNYVKGDNDIVLTSKEVKALAELDMSTLKTDAATGQLLVGGENKNIITDILEKVNAAIDEKGLGENGYVNLVIDGQKTPLFAVKDVYTDKAVSGSHMAFAAGKTEYTKDEAGRDYSVTLPSFISYIREMAQGVEKFNEAVANGTNVEEEAVELQKKGNDVLDRQIKEIEDREGSVKESIYQRQLPNSQWVYGRNINDDIVIAGGNVSSQSDIKRIRNTKTVGVGVSWKKGAEALTDDEAVLQRHYAYMYGKTLEEAQKLTADELKENILAAADINLMDDEAKKRGIKHREIYADLLRYPTFNNEADIRRMQLYVDKSLKDDSSAWLSQAFASGDRGDFDKDHWLMNLIQAKSIGNMSMKEYERLMSQQAQLVKHDQDWIKTNKIYRDTMGLDAPLDPVFGPDKAANEKMSKALTVAMQENQGGVGLWSLLHSGIANVLDDSDLSHGSKRAVEFLFGSVEQNMVGYKHILEKLNSTGLIEKYGNGVNWDELVKNAEKSGDKTELQNKINEVYSKLTEKEAMDLSASLLEGVTSTYKKFTENKLSAANLFESMVKEGSIKTKDGYVKADSFTNEYFHQMLAGDDKKGALNELRSIYEKYLIDHGLSEKSARNAANSINYQNFGYYESNGAIKSFADINWSKQKNAKDIIGQFGHLPVEFLQAIISNADSQIFSQFGKTLGSAAQEKANQNADNQGPKTESQLFSYLNKELKATAVSYDKVNESLVTEVSVLREISGKISELSSKVGSGYGSGYGSGGYGSGGVTRGTTLAKVVAGGGGINTTKNDKYDYTIADKLLGMDEDEAGKKLIGKDQMIKKGVDLATIAKYYGYDDVEKFVNLRENSINRDLGTDIHSINEQLERAFMDFDNRRRGSKGYNAKKTLSDFKKKFLKDGEFDLDFFTNAVAEQAGRKNGGGLISKDVANSILEKLGITRHNIDVRHSRIGMSSEDFYSKRLPSAIKNEATWGMDYVVGKGGRIIAVEQGVARKSGEYGTISQHPDLIALQQYNKLNHDNISLHEQGTEGLILDWKNPYGLKNHVDSNYMLQLIGYTYTMDEYSKRYKEIEKDMKSRGFNDDDILDAYKKKYGSKYSWLGDEFDLNNSDNAKQNQRFIEGLRDADRWRKFGIRYSDNEGKAKTVWGDISQLLDNKPLLDKAIGNDTDVTSGDVADIVKAVLGEQQYETLSKDGSLVIETQKELEEREREYLTTVGELAQIERQIIEVQKERWKALQLGLPLDEIEDDLKELEAQKSEKMAQKEELGGKGFSQQFLDYVDKVNDKNQEKQDKRNEKIGAKVGENGEYQFEYTKSDIEEIENAYEHYYSKRLSLENEIYKRKLAYGKADEQEAPLIENVIVALQEKLDLLKKANEQIVAEGNNLDTNSIKQTKANYKLESRINKRKAEAGTHGNFTLRDVMMNDIRRVGWRIANFGVISRLISKVPQSLNRVKQTTQQLEQALMNLRVVTGYNRKEGEALLVTYNSLSKQLGATTVEVANAADAWLRQGYSVADAENLIAASMKLSKLGKIDSAQATKSLKKDSLYSNI